MPLNKWHAHSFHRLGSMMERLSDSATWAEYRRAHPQARVGFVLDGSMLLLTLTDQFGQFRGIVKYAEDVHGLIEVAHLALQEERGIDVL